MERVPKKTARKGLKKRWIALILLLLLLAAGGGVLWARRAVLPPVPELPALMVRSVAALPSSKLIVTVLVPVVSFCSAEAFSVMTVLPATAV